jgi:hypothetical protein
MRAFAAVLLCVGVVLLACAGGRGREEEAAALAGDAAALAKIHLDLAAINAEGLAGPPDGLHAVSYEFCIPGTDEAVAQVQAIDRTVEVQRGARGRIGCGADQFLCVGHTHQPDHRAVLIRLARLDYVAAIEPFYGE